MRSRSIIKYLFVCSPVVHHYLSFWRSLRRTWTLPDSADCFSLLCSQSRKLSCCFCRLETIKDKNHATHCLQGLWCTTYLQTSASYLFRSLRSDSICFCLFWQWLLNVLTSSRCSLSQSVISDCCSEGTCLPPLCSWSSSWSRRLSASLDFKNAWSL